MAILGYHNFLVHGNQEKYIPYPEFVSLENEYCLQTLTKWNEYKKEQEKLRDSKKVAS